MPKRTSKNVTRRGRTPAMDRLVQHIHDPANAHLFTVESALHAFDIARGHVTPADGNVFADLGFAPDEAAALLNEADARINAAPAIERPRPGRDRGR